MPPRAEVRHENGSINPVLNIGGYHTNAADGEDEGSSEGWNLRGKLEWDLNERLNLLASAEYRVNDADCCHPAS